MSRAGDDRGIMLYNKAELAIHLSHAEQYPYPKNGSKQYLPSKAET